MPLVRGPVRDRIETVFTRLTPGQALVKGCFPVGYGSPGRQNRAGTPCRSERTLGDPLNKGGAFPPRGPPESRGLAGTITDRRTLRDNPGYAGQAPKTLVVDTPAREKYISEALGPNKVNGPCLYRADNNKK